MANTEIALVTDSTCDIPAALIERYNIFVQPHVLVWGNEQFRDRVEMSPEAFYRRLSADPVMPTTSQASAFDFVQAFQHVCAEGAREIVAVIVSSGLSGAIQSVTQAALETPVPVHIHDSREATMALGWQALAAARAREAGGGVRDMLEAAEKVRRGVQIIICLDTLEYVYRGGRIGNARRLLSAMLNVKALITVDHDSGVVEPVGVAVTRKRSIEQMYSRFFANFGAGRPLHVAVMHGDAEEEAQVLMERIRREVAPAELLTNITCPALGIHTGPRALALIGYME